MRSNIVVRYHKVSKASAISAGTCRDTLRKMHYHECLPVRLSLRSRYLVQHCPKTRAGRRWPDQVTLRHIQGDADEFEDAEAER